MKILREFDYLKGVQKEETNLSFQENIYPLDEIILSPLDIIAAYIHKITNNLSYPNLASIDIVSIPKNRDINEKIFNRYLDKIEEQKELASSDYNSNINVINNNIQISIKIIDRQPSSIKIAIIYNDGVNRFSENFDYTADFNAYPDFVYITKQLPFRIYFKNADYLRIGDEVIYEFKYLLPKLPAGGDFPGDYSFIFDNVNYNLIFDNQLNPEQIQIGYYSFGNILRPNSFNELLRVNQNLPFLLDTNLNLISLPEDILVPTGRVLFLIKKQKRYIILNSIPAGFSFIAIYLDKTDRILKYDVLSNSQSYTDIKNTISTVLIDSEKKIYLGFAIVENLINRLRQYDIQYLNFGSGGGGGGVNKFIYESCNRNFIIQYTQGQPPIIQFYDDLGNQFYPEKVYYNEVANQIEINIGTQICYKVVII